MQVTGNSVVLVVTRSYLLEPGTHGRDRLVTAAFQLRLDCSELGHQPLLRRLAPYDEVLCKQAVIGDDGRMQRFVPVEALFKGRHFDGQIIILCVSWYTSFKLSLRDLVIMMADRGIALTHTTILRWVQHYTYRNSRSVGADMLVRLEDPGGWTRHI